MVNGNVIEKRIYELIEPSNGISWRTFKVKPLTGETSLNHTMRMDPIDAAELLLEIFEEFGLDFNQLKFKNYFAPLSKDEKPLTIDMLIASAKAGRWLYD